MLKTFIFSVCGAAVFFTSIAIASMTSRPFSEEKRGAPEVDAGYVEHFTSVSKTNIYHVNDAGVLSCGD